MFYAFTKHESSDDIQCLSSGRTRWPQLSKQTCCRNHRRFISNGASRLGRATSRREALALRRRIHFPNPSTASKTIKVGSGLQLQVLPIRSNTRSIHHSKKIICFFCSRDTTSSFTSFHFRFSQSFSRIHPLGTTWNVSKPLRFNCWTWIRSICANWRKRWPASLWRHTSLQRGSGNHTSHGFCWDSKCWFFPYFLLELFYRFFLPQDFLEKWCYYLWIPNCWEARCSNSQNQSTKPCRRGLHGPVLGAFFSRHRPEVSHPVGRWFERHAL